MRRVLFLGETPTEFSAQPRHVPNKKRYRAYYRWNTQRWSWTVDFTATSDEEAIQTARAKLPKRRPKDLVWTVLDKLWCLDEPGTDTGETA
ncbi:hypothetical protein Dxin01_00119 [Deinococcus xinjiangensis]|uniref:Uncharacterized protein n=1 Tax=Deinococcus xinjiangensis TaxID=457454 RepID=A0ABP9V531_9DEIO